MKKLRNNVVRFSDPPILLVSCFMCPSYSRECHQVVASFYFLSTTWTFPAAEDPIHSSCLLFLVRVMWSAYYHRKGQFPKRICFDDQIFFQALPFWICLLLRRFSFLLVVRYILSPAFALSRFSLLKRTWRFDSAL